MFYIYEWFNVDTNEIFYVGKGTANRYRVRNRNVDKKQFSSKLEAAKYLNVSVTTLNKALKNMNTDKLKNIICEYANQQPSCGNTDDSTTKGSTTNG